MTTIQRRIFFIIPLCILMMFSLVFAGCNQSPDPLSVISIEKTETNGLVDTYTISYSDGSTYEFTVTNGTNGTDGINGKDGKDLSIQEIYDLYVEEYGEISYADFVKNVLEIDTTDNRVIINQCLRSCLKVYTEFNVTTYSGFGYFQEEIDSVAVNCGSAVIYKIDNDYTYIITNYHVVYNHNANADNGSTKIARAIYGYLYGSEGAPVDNGDTDSKGYAIYDYGNYAIPLTYVGGSIKYDLAILKTETSKLMAINDKITAVDLADKYYVGETAIAIGNPENEGISVSEGIVSVDNEYISLAIDNVVRSYRSIRMDTAIYGGSSGGGLFNAYGELIGITNAGDTEDQNINYAIPIQIVKNVTENILENYNGTTPTSVYKPTIGFGIKTSNSKYTYDETNGYGYITETVSIASVTENSIADIIGLDVDYQLVSIIINNNEFTLNRYFEIDDILLSTRINDTIQFKYTYNNSTTTTEPFLLIAEHFNAV